MIFRQGTIDEMSRRWYKRHTSEYFMNNIKDGNAEFWTIDNGGLLIGELYLFKNLNDSDFADGETTAYLCAFRIDEAMRGKGFGTGLMNCVLNRLRKLGFMYATIGVELTEEENIRLYRKLGFTEKIKIIGEDPCNVDENYIPLKCTKFMLLRKSL